MDNQLSKEIALKHLEKVAFVEGGSEREDEFFGGFLKGLGVPQPSKMTEVDAEKLLGNLASEECSEEFVESLVYWLLRQSISLAAKEAILESDIDGDGVPLWQELVDGTNPFVNDRNSLKQSYLGREISRGRDLEV